MASPPTVKDRMTGETYQIRAKYLIGARRRPLQGRRGHRPADERQDGRRRLDEHHHRGRPLEVRRPPAERPLLGTAARLQRRRHRHGPRPHGAAMERVADRSGATTSTARSRWSTTSSPRSIAHSLIGDDNIPVKIKSVSTWTVNHMHALRVFARPGVLHGRCLPSSSAVERARLQHLDPGRLQPRLEARPRAQGQGVAEAARQLLGRTGADRQADRRPRQQVDRRVRTDLRVARPAVDHRPEADERQHGGAARRTRRRAKRGGKKLREAIAYKVYEFDAHGVEMNQRYRSERRGA